MYKLREPQQITYDKIKKSVSQGNKKVLVMACTGFGKTILSYQISKDAIAKNNRVLFTSHRITLAEQTRDKFFDLNPSFLQGDTEGYIEDYKVLVATLQTLSTTEIKEPRVIIIDECHYAYESNYIQSLFERWPNAVFIGLSATPTDDKGYLLNGFNAIIDDYQTADLIELGWLVPFKVFSPIKINTENVKVSKTTNDFNEKELLEQVKKQDINKSIVENYIKLGEGRKFICFAVNKSHCNELKKEFEKYGVFCEIISADTSKKSRDLILKQYEENEIHGLISIEILTAGFDDPTVKCIILATKTMQWKKFVQMCGRGIRLLGQSLTESISNEKGDCLLLDCAGNIEEHGMPDDKKELKFGVKISRVLDREFNLDVSIEDRKQLSETITEEKQVYLKQIGSLLDLYDNKVYAKESEFQEDANNYLDKTGYFYWRQNSGKMFKDGRWIHFASKSGLPDNSVFYKNTSLFFGLELKLKHGSLTKHQKETLPEMIQKKVLFFICESVFEIYKAIEHVENNIEKSEEGILIKNSIYDLPEWQINTRLKLKL